MAAVLLANSFDTAMICNPNMPSLNIAYYYDI